MDDDLWEPTLYEQLNESEADDQEQNLIDVDADDDDENESTPGNILQKLLENYEYQKINSNKQAIYWCFFRNFPGNENKDKYYCIVCHDKFNQKFLKTNQKIKGVLCLGPSGSNAFKLHANSTHKDLLDEVVEKTGKQNIVKKRKISQQSQIKEFFRPVNQYQKQSSEQKNYELDLCLLVGKALMPIHMVTSIWMSRYTLRRDKRINLINYKDLRYTLLPQFVKYIQETYVNPFLTNSLAVSLTYDLWMSMTVEDVFSVIAQGIDKDWQLRRVLLGLINCISGTKGEDLALPMQNLIQKNQIMKIIAHCSDGGSNLETMRIALESCNAPNNPRNNNNDNVYYGDCLAHVINNALNHSLRQTNFNDINIDINALIQKMQVPITYIKKSGRGWDLWNQACTQSGLKTIKIPTPVKTRFCTRIVTLQKCVEYKQAIIKLHDFAKKAKSISNNLISNQDWETIEQIVEVMWPVVQTIKKLEGVLIITDFLIVILKFICNFYDNLKQLKNVETEIQNFDEEEEVDVILQVKYALFNKILSYVRPYLEPLLIYNEKKAHYLMALMLDPRTANLEMIQKLAIVYEINIQIVKQTINSVIQIDFKNIIQQQQSNVSEQNTLQNVSSSSIFFDEDCIDKNENLVKDIKNELFKIRKVNITEQSDFQILDWWKNNNQFFVLLSNVAKVILGIPCTAIENERVFSIAGILSQVRRNRSSVELMDIISQIYYNYPNDGLTSINDDVDEIEQLIDEDELQLV